MTSILWIRVGDDYMAKDGKFLISSVLVPGVREGATRTMWALFVRCEGDKVLKEPWSWHDEPICLRKTKKECQDEASVWRGSVPLYAGGRPPRGARKGESDDDDPNSTCWCCLVRFKKTAKWRYGDLCGSNCAAIVKEVADEVTS